MFILHRLICFISRGFVSFQKIHLFYFLEGFAIYFLYGKKKSKATYANNLVKELQLSETHDSTDETDYKHPTQSIMTELDNPMLISGLNSGLILQHDLKQNLSSKMNSDDLQKSLAYISDLERILDCEAEEYYNRDITTTSNSVDYVTEHEIKNSTITHKTPLPSTSKSSVVSESTLSVVPELSASLVSSPATVSLPPEHIQTTANINHVKRSPSSKSARNLYPNVVIISYDSDDEDREQEKEGVSGKGKYGDNTETEENRTASSQTFFQRDSVSENQEYLPAHKQDTNMEGSRTNAEPRKQSPSPPPFFPPPPPPLPPPFTAFPPSSLKTVLTSSNIVGESVSFEGDPDASPNIVNSKSRDNINSEEEVTTRVTPDTKLLLRMRSFKTSDFASKLEAMLQEKLHDAKYDTGHENSQLFTKHSTNTENDANTGKLKHHSPIVNIDTNKQLNGMAENWNDSVAESNLIQNKADGQLTDREMELADIKGKLEQFLANRADASVLPRPLNHPNIFSLTDESNEMKHEIDGAQLKQFPKKPLLNGTKELKINNENNNFDIMRKQRLLMGQVLASIKFIASKNTANSESSISGASEEDEVFEDLTSHTEVSIKDGR
jgi:hypothetical protein